MIYIAQSPGLSTERHPPSGQVPAQLLTTNEVMAITRLSKRKIQNEVSSGSIGHVRFGRSLRFIPIDVAEYIEARRVQRKNR
jgi:excisionase family DNA binding protein